MSFVGVHSLGAPEAEAWDPAAGVEAGGCCRCALARYLRMGVDLEEGDFSPSVLVLVEVTW